MKRSNRPRFLIALGMCGALWGPAAEAAAKHPGSVTACSRYGNGCYTAPVRKGKFGPEMRLKNGTWIDCRGDCRQALREETVDFWETQNNKAMIIRP